VYFNFYPAQNDLQSIGAMGVGVAPLMCSLTTEGKMKAFFIRKRRGPKKPRNLIRSCYTISYTSKASWQVLTDQNSSFTGHSNDTAIYEA
jgi:hypothetical protein